MEQAGLHIGSTYLKELLKEHDDPRKVNGIWQLIQRLFYGQVNQYEQESGEAVEALRSAWNKTEGSEFSVYLIMGMCYLLQCNRIHPDFEFDLGHMVQL